MTFRTNPLTGDIVKLFDEDAIKASVLNLVLTMNYEEPFHPEIGCAVMESLFDNMSPVMAVKIKRSIEDVLRNFEPRIIVIGVQVQADIDLNQYAALIVYRIINQVDPVQISAFLQKRR